MPCLLQRSPQHNASRAPSNAHPGRGFRCGCVSDAGTRLAGSRITLRAARVKTKKAFRKRDEGSPPPPEGRELLAGFEPARAIAVLEPLAGEERRARITEVVNARI